MKKKKLMIAFLMLLVSAVTLTTASYAWFTANQTVALAGLDINVQASNGIQISTDAVTWKGALTVTDITTNGYVGNRNQVPLWLGGTGTSMAPASAPKTLTTGLLDMWEGDIDASLGTPYIVATQVSDPTAAVGAAAASTSGNYLTFDIFVQTTASQSLYLTKGSGVFTSGTDNGMKNAARIAIVNEGYAATPAAAIALWSGTAAYLWEPNANAHTTNAINHALSSYGLTVGATDVIASYYAVSDDMLLTDNVTVDETLTYFTLLETPASNDIDLQTNVNLTGVEWTRTSGYVLADDAITTIVPGINKLRVYAWFEGQDIDCENFASGTTVLYNLGFTINTPSS